MTFVELSQLAGSSVPDGVIGVYGLGGAEWAAVLEFTGCSFFGREWWGLGV